MPYSNYPHGFLHGVTIRGLPILQTNPGEVFWVGNGTASGLSGHRGSSDNNRGTFADPFATLDYAVGRCTASRGDLILVKPGHAETYSAATSLALDKAGISVVGLGTGSLRPTFTCDTVDTTPIVVSAANVGIKNCLFVANFLSIAGCFTLTTAANFACDGNEFRDTTAAKNWLNVIKSTGAANTVDGLYVCDNVYQSIGTTFNTFILSANDIAFYNWSNNIINSINTDDDATLAIISAGVIPNGIAKNNITVRRNTTNTVALISVGGTTSYGELQGNFCRTLDTAGNIVIVTTAGFACQGNSYSGVLSAQGFAIPALDS